MFNIFKKNKNKTTNTTDNKNIKNDIATNDTPVIKMEELYAMTESMISDILIDKNILEIVGMKTIFDTPNLENITDEDLDICIKFANHMDNTETVFAKVLKEGTDKAEAELVKKGATIIARQEHPFFTFDNFLNLIKTAMAAPVAGNNNWSDSREANIYRLQNKVLNGLPVLEQLLLYLMICGADIHCATFTANINGQKYIV